MWCNILLCNCFTNNFLILSMPVLISEFTICSFLCLSWTWDFSDYASCGLMRRSLDYSYIDQWKLLWMRVSNVEILYSFVKHVQFTFLKICNWDHSHANQNLLTVKDPACFDGTPYIHHTNHIGYKWSCPLNAHAHYWPMMQKQI